MITLTDTHILFTNHIDSMTQNDIEKETMIRVLFHDCSRDLKVPYTVNQLLDPSINYSLADDTMLYFHTTELKANCVDTYDRNLAIPIHRIKYIFKASTPGYLFICTSTAGVTQVHCEFEKLRQAMYDYIRTWDKSGFIHMTNVQL